VSVGLVTCRTYAYVGEVFTITDTTGTVPYHDPSESARHVSSMFSCSFRFSLCRISMRSAQFEAHVWTNITIDCQAYDRPCGI
jgi:hypothetical protein